MEIDPVQQLINLLRVCKEECPDAKLLREWKSLADMNEPSPEDLAQLEQEMELILYDAAAIGQDDPDLLML